MESNSAKILIPAVVIILGFAAIFGLSVYLEKNRPPLPAGFEDSDLALQGAKLKGYALGFEGLIADWYWMQSLQYIGDKIIKNPDKNISVENLNELNPRLLYYYLDNATTLDPKFTIAYGYGATVLPAIDSEQAIKILQKGIAGNPDEWRLYHYLGYIYWKLKRYEEAAAIYAQGAAVKNAPDWMKIMGARMKSDGGSRETARALYRQTAETADSETRKVAENRLLELDSLDERDAVRPVLQDFKAKAGRCANNWREILPLLKSIKLPEGKDFRIDNDYNLVDPTGAAYILNKEKCDIELDWKKTKIPAR